LKNEGAVVTEKIVTVFGSSRPKAGDAEYEKARELGKVLAQRGLAVCSGGFGGVMEGVSRGAKEGGGKTYAVTAEFFKRKANAWVDTEVRMETWDARLFELIRLADGFAVCKGGTGTLVELAVVWEMLNKSVIAGKPIVVVGDFWQPVLDRVREVEQGPRPSTEDRIWGEANGNLIYSAPNAQAAVQYLADRLGI
jgi:hypothetical protein